MVEIDTICSLILSDVNKFTLCSESSEYNTITLCTMYKEMSFSILHIIL